jgi:cytochrome c biogenesis protein CcdA
VFRLLAEGIESLRLPCSWVLLIPAIGLAVFGRRRSALIIGTYVFAAGLIAFLRFGGWWFATPSSLIQIPLGLVLLAAIFGAWKVDRPVTDGLVAGLSGVAAAWSWIPCVGPHLGDLLNEARTDPWSQLGGTFAYIVGLLIPFVIIAALDQLFPELRTRLERPGVILAGVVLLSLFGLALATTVFDDFSSELARRSTF